MHEPRLLDSHIVLLLYGNSKSLGGAIYPHIIYLLWVANMRWLLVIGGSGSSKNLIIKWNYQKEIIQLMFSGGSGSSNYLILKGKSKIIK